MYTRPSQAYYPRGGNPDAEQLPLRSRAFSHIENTSHQSSHHQQSTNTTFTDDKISEIKKKYDKPIIQNLKKAYGENSNVSFQAVSHNKSVSIHEANEENNKWNNKPSYQQVEKSQGKSLSTKPYLQKDVFGKGSVKSELENNRITLNNMKNQLQSKLNDLNAKTQGSINNCSKIETIQKRENESPYDLILSKYSKDIDPRLVRPKLGAQANQNHQNSDLKNIDIGKQDISSNYQGRPSTTNRSTIFDNATNYRQQASQLSTITQTNSNHSEVQKDSHLDKQKQNLDCLALRKNACRTGESIIVNDRRLLNEKTYKDQRTTLSYIDDKREKLRNINLEFTLQKEGNDFQLKLQQNEAMPSGKSSLSTNKVPSKYDYNILTKYERGPSNHQNQMLKSQIPTKQNKTTLRKGQGRDNEAISRQIQKLDIKIRQIQQNKKALNINFSPYPASKSISKSAIGQQNFKIDISRFQKEEDRSKNNNTVYTPSCIDKSKFSSSIRHQQISNSPMYSRKAYPQKMTKYEKSISIPYTPAESQNDDEQIISERSTADPIFKSKINNYTFNAETEVFNPYRTDERKKEGQSRAQVNNTIKNLVKVLGEQVSFDQIFRNNKIWFASQNQDKKWILLKKELQNNGVNLSETELRQAFRLEQSENNPFFSVSDAKCTFESLAKSYIQSQTHWNQKISHKFDKNDLERGGFSNSKMDYDRKGFIQVQDLVRFLNIESGSFFRNRDLSIILRRISKGSQIQFRQLLDAISI